MPGAPASRPAPAAPDETGVAVDQRLTDIVSRLRRTLRASIRSDFPWEALPMAQVEMLQTLSDMGPSRVSDLADHQHLANSTVSGLIAQLIDSGHVQRQTDPDDRRAAVVSLTASGKAQLARWEQAHKHRIGRGFQRLSPADRRAIGAALPALDRLTRLLADPPDQLP